jgi:peptidoglycan/LPS O-acetylase OafA/YrhL
MGGRALKQTHRYLALDGLRGLASLMVLFSHYVYAFWPHLYIGGGGPTDWQTKIAISPVFTLYSGMYAVFIFFVLSGFVMAEMASSSADGFISLAIRRVIRLMVPVAASVLFAFGLILLFPHAPQIYGKPFGLEWLSNLYVHGAGSIVWQDLTYRPFLGGSYYNLALWTMRPELCGSILIFAVYCTIGARWRVPCLAGITIGLTLLPIEWWTNLFPMFCGALLSEFRPTLMRTRGRFEWIWGLAFILALYFGGEPRAGAGGTIYAFAADLANRLWSAYYLCLTLGGVLMVASAIVWAPLQSILTSPIVRFLGRISFGLYLVHVPLLGTVLVALLTLIGGSPIGFAAASAIYLIIAIGAAWLFSVLIDEPVVLSLRKAAGAYRGFTQRRVVSTKEPVVSSS